MLQDIRSGIRGTTAKIIIGLIVISFSIFGIESILLGGGSDSVAEVNGEDISNVELQQMVNTQKRQLIQMMGDNIDPAMLDDQLLGGRALESLISRKLLLQAADDHSLTVSTGAVAGIIVQMPQFQVEERFSKELYNNLISNAGFTDAGFRQNMRDDLIVNQLRAGFAGSEFITPQEMDLVGQIAGEQRDFRYLVIPKDQFRAEVDISEEAISDYYDVNALSFMTEQSLDLDYIELSPEQFIQPVEESVLRQEYEAEMSNYEYQEQRRVSHILLEQKADESEEAWQARADLLGAELAGGADFSELARTQSDDIGSSGSGGDLGFTSGDAFPEEMESAISELSLNQISEPLRTDAGIHLIKVTEIREAEAPGFEALRTQIEQRVQQQEAERELLRAVETLKDLAYNAESLNEPAAELDLEVEHAKGVTRSQADGVFAQPALQRAAFSDDVLVEGYNSEVIELAGNRHVVLRVASITEAVQKPLTEVREGIVTTLAEQAAEEALVARATDILARLRAGESVEAVALEEDYTWQVELGVNRDSNAVSAAVNRRLFSLPVPGEGESLYDFVLTPNDEAHVVELFRVNPGSVENLNKEQKERLQQRAVGQNAQLADEQFRRAIRDRADITTI